MNWKKLVTIAALTGFSASVATGQGTAPTIVQGDYISNVFGNSNFIKNPNAKLNTANVTVSSATVTRSTTTPLVATSEFNITTSTATGYADWSTRTFDAGMKGQNCEARFTYRGFSVGTTTAQVLQGANVVAQLALTASTDPRIASINFPCGDLSAATTFRLQQATAALTGTNEIGGIYVGLATNMANVAQAEMYGGMEYSGGSQNTWNITQTTYTNDFAASGSNSTAFGKCSAPSTAVPQLICNNMPSGEYQIVWPIYIETNASNNIGYCRVVEASTGSVAQEVSMGSYNTGLVDYTGRTATIVGNVSFSSVGSRTFKLQCKASAAISVLALRFAAQNSKIIVNRFPSSSELVVTPERQNTFAAARFTSVNATLHNGGTAPTGYSVFTSADFAANVARFGKAAAPLSSGCVLSCSANDFGFSVPNLPVGSYSVRVNGLLNASVGTNTTECSFQILEAVTGTSVAKQSHVDPLLSGLSSREFNASYAGVFTNTSVATRNFIIRAEKISGSTTGSCQVNAAAQRDLYMELIPLDQPSNAALYVQGPVLGAQTGATIAAGYVGETIESTQTGTTTPTTSNQWYTSESVTLTPGVWNCYALGVFYYSGGGSAPTGFTAFNAGICTGTNCNPSQPVIGFNGTNYAFTTDGLNFGGGNTISKIFNVTSSTSYSLSTRFTFTARGSLVIDNNESVLRCTRLN